MIPETSVRREVVETDVVVRGAGVAGLACAAHLLRVLERSGAARASVMVLEKSAGPGQHILSGAVVDPAPFRDLLQPEELGRLPFGQKVAYERMLLLLSRRHTIPVPFVPPPLRSRGLPVLSLSELVSQLAGICEQRGVEIYYDTAVTDLLLEGGKVTGVRLVDRGRRPDGQPGPGYEPGADVKAKVVVIAEGAAGPLVDRLQEKGVLRPAPHPPTYALGIKELIRVPPREEIAGLCVHTLGYPLSRRASGGGFIYGIDASTVAAGLVIGLEYQNPWLETHVLFRAFKRHPQVARLIAGGEVIGYGAKVIPEGGIPAVPGLAGEGVIVVGDAGGLVDPVRTKGVHLAVRSGLLAAETIAEAILNDDYSAGRLRAYESRLQQSPEWRQAERFRNVRSWFRLGLLPAVAATAAGWLSYGWLPPLLKRRRTDRFLKAAPPPAIAPFSELGRGKQSGTDLDLLSDLYHSGTEHREDQPSHITISDPEVCRRDCLPNYGGPCTRFCPAQVYELDQESAVIRIQASNCLHCRTCRIKCPLDNIGWQVPEAGGPRYRRM